MPFSRIFTIRSISLFTVFLGSLKIYHDIKRLRPIVEKVSLTSTLKISHCFQWQLINDSQSIDDTCMPYSSLISSIWTHDGTGIMKYIQWIVTRKLANIKISRLNDKCQLIQEDKFFSDSQSEKFIQVYLLSLDMNISQQSRCSLDLIRITEFGFDRINQIYFKRRSLKATMLYQSLDRKRSHLEVSILNKKRITKANIITRYIENYFLNKSNAKTIVIDSEDLIHSDSNTTQSSLTSLVSLFGIDTTTSTFQNILLYDYYHFLSDSTWWDQSTTIEKIYSTPFDHNAGIFDTTGDFYHLNGNVPLEKYFSDNRQCFNDGTFYQLQTKIISDIKSTEEMNQCATKQFECAFSDLYSFQDREQLYRSYSKYKYFNPNPIKCGFNVPSILDRVRQRYQYNGNCEIIVLTCITDCYDPLPTIHYKIPSNTCFVALLDTKTLQAFKEIDPTRRGMNNLRVQWDLIDIGKTDSLFRFSAKITETFKTLGHRMFPLAKWIVWLDGKAFIININQILAQARKPILSLRHFDANRTPLEEANLTIARLTIREQNHPIQLNSSIEEVKLQTAQYQREGFYNRSIALKLPMYDIAIFIYRNNHPCSLRYLCGWHNEINYFSYRGQMSVYYSAERLNLTNYLGIVPRELYHTMAHRAIC